MKHTKYTRILVFIVIIYTSNIYYTVHVTRPVGDVTKLWAGVSTLNSKCVPSTTGMTSIGGASSTSCLASTKQGAAKCSRNLTASWLAKVSIQGIHFVLIFPSVESVI